MRIVDRLGVSARAEQTYGLGIMMEDGNRVLGSVHQTWLVPLLPWRSSVPNRS